MDRNIKKRQTEVVGIIPAAGRASRISPLPCSKELYPVGFHSVDGNNSVRPKVVSHYLLEKMSIAGIRKAYIILRDGKWDIPSYFGAGNMVNMDLAYLMMDLPYGVPYTLDQAYPFVQDSIVALGFPDILFRPDNAFSQLLIKQAECRADVVLGLFPAAQPNKTDMVEIDNNGEIVSIHIRPEKTKLEYSWEIAVWNRVFTEFMHGFVLSREEDYIKTDLSQQELSVSEVLQAAIKNKLKVNSVIFKNGNFLDIGTVEDLAKANKFGI